MNRLAALLLMLGLAWPVQAMEWQWLDQMRDAIQQLDYQGVYLHRRGDTTRAYAIAHSTREGEPVELLRQLDGAMIEVLRRGNRLVCYYPAGAEDQMDEPVPAAPFAQIGPMALDRIAASYAATAAGQARVAGRDARVVTLEPDAWRYRHKLWLDRATGLLLQSQLMGEDGEVLEEFRYTRLTLDEAVPDAALQPTLAGDRARRQTLFHPDPAEPETASHRTEPAWLPPGFELQLAERHEQAGGWLEKRVYSDGLATVSVFVEPRMPDEPVSIARMGATTALMGETGDWTVTVIGEVPPRTARRLLASVRRVQ